MTRHGVWIGISVGDVLCGSNGAYMLVQEMRDHEKMLRQRDDRVLMAVRRDDALLGYGVPIATTPRNGSVEFKGDELAGELRKVKLLMSSLGIHGPVTVHAEETDWPPKGNLR